MLYPVNGGTKTTHVLSNNTCVVKNCPRFERSFRCMIPNLEHAVVLRFYGCWVPAGVGHVVEGGNPANCAIWPDGKLHVKNRSRPQLSIKMRHGPPPLLIV